MKPVFGILSLVVVVPQQARSIQERARDHTVRALEQGAERNRRADR
jgi:hypothetical protein